MATELERLEAALNRQEAVVRDAFNTFVRQVQSPQVLREVRLLLQRGDIQGAIDTANQHVLQLGTVVPRIFQPLGDVAVAELAAQLGGAAVGISFDPAYPLAASLMQASRLDLITNITTQQTEAIRTVLTRALQTGQGPIAAAREFSNAIGLTSTQLAAAQKYQQALELGARAALDYALRDRRFDSSVVNAADGDTPLTARQIETMVSRYRASQLRLRAQTIARTETVRALSQAREAALQQMLEQTGMPADRVIRTWNATLDDRTRDTHRDLDGQQRALNQPFDSSSGAKLMYPGDPSAPAAETINCRCVLTTSFKPLQGAARGAA